MTQLECELALIKKLEEAVEIYKQFNPDGNHLSIFWMGDTYHVTGYTGEYDENGYALTDVNATKFTDGTYRFNIHGCEKIAEVGA